MAKLNESEIVKMRIKRIEKEIRDTPYHKGTEHHIGRLRARLAHLKDKMYESQSKKGGGGGGYAVKHQGDATVVLVGPPSVGKSTLLNKLTNANSKIAPYEFTTVSVIPGMMEYKDAKIQILDVPGLIRGAEEGKGRGREVLSVIRGSDLLIIMSDHQNLDSLDSITQALERNGIRINKTKPKISIEKRLSGGVILHSNFKQDLSNQTIKDVANEMGLKNAEITINEKVTIDNLIDSFTKNRVYIPAIYVINKIDIKNAPVINLHRPTTYISAEKGTNLEKLKETIWNELDFVRIYLVREDEEPSNKNPMIMKKGQLLYDVMNLIGQEFAENKGKAKIWGSGAKFPGQEVSLKTEAKEGMQVRFI